MKTFIWIFLVLLVIYTISCIAFTVFYTIHGETTAAATCALCTAVGAVNVASMCMNLGTLRNMEESDG